MDFLWKTLSVVNVWHMLPCLRNPSNWRQDMLNLAGSKDWKVSSQLVWRIWFLVPCIEHMSFLVLIDHIYRHFSTSWYHASRQESHPKYSGRQCSVRSWEGHSNYCVLCSWSESPISSGHVGPRGTTSFFVNSRKCWYYNSLTDMHDSCRRATPMLWTEEVTAASWKKFVKHVLQQQRATLFESEEVRSIRFSGGSKSLLLPDRLGRYSKVTAMEASGTSWFAVAPVARRRQKQKKTPVRSQVTGCGNPKR